MLCHGDMVSASILRRGLDEFTLSSGLYPSMNKSEAFFCNIPNEIRNDIKLVMPFREGCLPIRYLRVPLVTKMVTSKVCRALIDSIKNRVNSWKNKCLSFAGRLQLVASVLSSLHIYWCSLFILPMAVCKTIDSLFCSFLWAKGENSRGMVSVCWTDVCKPKSQGGLGLKFVHEWNNALMAKHLWNILSNKETIWVKWVKIHRIKGKNLWDVELKSGQSWAWKHLLKLRD